MVSTKLFPKFLVFAAAFTLAFFVFVQEVEATGYYVSTTPSKARIRSKPVSGKVVTKVKKGTKLRIISRNDERDVKKLWLKVELPSGGEGWIAARITKFVQQASGGAEPIPDTSFDEPILDEPTLDAAPTPTLEEPAAQPDLPSEPEELPTLDEGADEILLEDEDIPEIEILDADE